MNQIQKLDPHVQHNNQESDTIWSSYDLHIAAVAKTLGHELIDVDRSAHPNKALFVFEESEELLELVDDFYADRVSVNPRLLLDSLKLLKNRIYASS